jgi:hypothetical protein
MSSTKPIGGYFGLGEESGALIYPEAYPVNLGRNGLLIIARERAYTDIWVPAYICGDVVDILQQNQIRVRFYRINEKLEPVDLPSLKKSEAFLYVNYFGIKDQCSKKYSAEISNLILDLSQAFFFTPPSGIDAFNSARKFLGVPDGGFLFGNLTDKINLLLSQSFDRMTHLAMRADGLVKEGYPLYRQHEAQFKNSVPMKMSLLTQSLLRNRDLTHVARQRYDNFLYVCQCLKKVNQLDVEENNCSPLCYPLLIENGKALKEKLIQNSIFVPTYWPDIHIDETMVYEKKVQEHLVCLPIDQRYDISDMNRIVEIVNG